MYSHIHYLSNFYVGARPRFCLFGSSPNCPTIVASCPHRICWCGNEWVCLITKWLRCVKSVDLLYISDRICDFVKVEFSFDAHLLTLWKLLHAHPTIRWTNEFTLCQKVNKIWRNYLVWMNRCCSFPGAWSRPRTSKCMAISVVPVFQQFLAWDSCFRVCDIFSHSVFNYSVPGCFGTLDRLVSR